jgi:hypothetical protein
MMTTWTRGPPTEDLVRVMSTMKLDLLQWLCEAWIFYEARTSSSSAVMEVVVKDKVESI